MATSSKELIAVQNQVREIEQWKSLAKFQGITNVISPSKELQLLHKKHFYSQ